MATAEKMNVQVRKETGKRKVKQLRASGKIPAVIYGHGEETVNLSLPSEEFSRIVHRGDRIVSLTGGVATDAFIYEVQWDVFGSRIMHVDFTRVAAGEMIETTVAIVLRGVSPGTKMGGTVDHALHEMVIHCPPRSMTDKIEVSINDLEFDQKITVGDLEMPEGSKASLDADTVVVQCIEKIVMEEEDEDASVATGAEPEVIGEKKEDEAGDNS